MQGLRPEHQVHLRRALQERLAFLRGDAAADADQYLRVRGLQCFPATELRENFLLRLFADRAGVDQDDVGFGLDQRQLQTLLGREYVGHAVRVIHIHLAALGLDVQLAGRRAGRGIRCAGQLGNLGVPGHGAYSGRDRPAIVGVQTGRGHGFVT